LAKHDPGHLYFADRNKKSANLVVSEIQSIAPNVPTTFLKCELADLSSLKSCAQKFLASESRLDVLICNAGIMAVPAGTTKDGYEIQFGTHHLGYPAPIELLLPTPLSTADQPESDMRIVILTSTGYAAYSKGGILFDGLTILAN